MGKGNFNNIIKLGVATLAVTFLLGCGSVFRKNSSSSSSSSSGGSSSSSSSGGSSGSSSTTITLNVTTPSVTGTIFAASDTSVTTLSFTHDGDSVLCSHDNGVTYAACDTASTLLFTAADYTGGAILKIKVTKSGATDEVYSYTPSTALPGLTFYTCDVTVSADETFDTFEARVNANNKIVCVNSGVTISNSDAIGESSISFGMFGGMVRYSGIKVIGMGSGNSRPLFQTTRTGDWSVFNILEPNIVLANLRATAVATGDTAIWISEQGDGASATLSNVAVSATGAGASAVWVETSAVYTNTFTASTFTSSGAGSNAIYMANPNTVVTVSSSTITNSNTGYAIYMTGTLTMSSSTVVDAATAHPAVYIDNNGSATMTNTTITAGYNGVQTDSQGAFSLSGSSSAITASNYGIYMTSAFLQAITLDQVTITTGVSGIYANNSFNSTITLNRSTIKHTSGSGSDGYALHLIGSPIINSTLNTNLFCNVGTATPWFLSSMNGAMDAGSTFVLASQTNSGVVSTCP